VFDILPFRRTEILKTADPTDINVHETKRAIFSRTTSFRTTTFDLREMNPRFY